MFRVPRVDLIGEMPLLPDSSWQTWGGLGCLLMAFLILPPALRPPRARAKELLVFPRERPTLPIHQLKPQKYTVYSVNICEESQGILYKTNRAHQLSSHVETQPGDTLTPDQLLRDQVQISTHNLGGHVYTQLYEVQDANLRGGPFVEVVFIIPEFPQTLKPDKKRVALRTPSRMSWVNALLLGSLWSNLLDSQNCVRFMNWLADFLGYEFSGWRESFSLSRQMVDAQEATTSISLVSEDGSPVDGLVSLLGLQNGSLFNMGALSRAHGRLAQLFEIPGYSSSPLIYRRNVNEGP